MSRLTSCIIILLLVLPSLIFSQTWSDDVSTIFYSKCAQCHHNGGIAPTPLVTYPEVSAMAAAVYDAVNQNHMPPWPPDNTYQQYAHDRALSATEKSTVLNWILAGSPEGNAVNTPPPPVFNMGALLGAGDLTVRIPTYSSKANGSTDDYACFAIPSGLTQNRVIKSIEIIPGNREIVHHALIYIDPTGNEQTDTTGFCGSPSLGTTKLVAGYTPGSTPMTLPSQAPLKLGINMQANSKVYFAMHYPAGSAGMLDSTRVIFHFYPVNTTGIRPVFADAVLQNWTFQLPPEQLTTVTAKYPASGGLNQHISLLSVFPHMHLLGKSIKAYAISPTNDTIKFANLKHWDFHWQDFYFFKTIQKAPTGSVLHAEGLYDNTSNNIHNPSNPPILVKAGHNTTDEMFLVYFHYTLYQAGDETYNMEELMSASLNEQLDTEDVGLLRVYPNPSAAITTFDFGALDKDATLSLIIYDRFGKEVKTLARNQWVHAGTRIEWDGTNQFGSPVNDSWFIASYSLDGKLFALPVLRNSN